LGEEKGKNCSEFLPLIIIISNLIIMILNGLKYELSEQKNKKLKVFKNNRWIHFGDNRYEHYFDKTGLLNKNLNHMDKVRRDAYLARAKKITDKGGKLTFKDNESPNYYAVRVLW